MALFQNRKRKHSPKVREEPQLEDREDVDGLHLASKTRKTGDPIRKFSGCLAKSLLVMSVIDFDIGLFKTCMHDDIFTAEERAVALHEAEFLGRTALLQMMVNSKMFRTTARTQVIIFVCRTIDRLKDRPDGEGDLRRVVERLPPLLRSFALILGQSDNTSRGARAMDFVLDHQSNLVETFEERLRSCFQEASAISQARLASRRDSSDTCTSDSSWRRQHDLQKHSKHVSMECPRCDQNFEDKSHLIRHMKSAKCQPRRANSDKIITWTGDRSEREDSLKGTSTLDAPSKLRTDESLGLRTRIFGGPALSGLTGLSEKLDSAGSASAADTIDVDLDFMLEQPANRLFVREIQNLLHWSVPEANIFFTIQQSLSDCFSSLRADDPHVSFQKPTVVLDLQWDLQAFLHNGHFGETATAKEIFTNYLSLNCDGVYSQALTAQNYIQALWGNFGKRMLSLIIRVTQYSHATLRCEGCHIQAQSNNSLLSVEMTGTTAKILKIVELLTWMGSSMRCNASKGILHSYSPVIGTVKHEYKLTPSLVKPVIHIYRLSITYQEDVIRPPSSDDRCWHNLFQYPVMSMGFPVALRDPSMPGLEMSLATIMAVAQSKYIGKFDNSVVIKSYSTMLTLSKRVQESCSWHVHKNLDGSYISYEDIKDSGNFPDINPLEIKQGRHFVGWCDCSTYGAGSLSGDYTIGPSFADLVVERSFFADKSLLRGCRVEAETVCVASDENKFHWNSDTNYIKSINRIHSNFVTLWDMAGDRGWLVNGTSALLHLVLASLHSESRQDLSNKLHFDVRALKCSSTDGPKKAADVLLNDYNLDLVVYPAKNGNGELFKDRVQDIYQFLERMLTYQVIATRKKLVPAVKLEGWDFMDIADINMGVIFPRAVSIDNRSAGWTTIMADATVLTLFGREFGEIFEPQNRIACKYWSQLPRNLWYLAATICDLEQMMKRYGNPLKEPKNLTHNLTWIILPSTFERCDCGGAKTHHTLVQTLMNCSKAYKQDKSHTIPFAPPVKGAAIFGPRSDGISPERVSQRPNQIGHSNSPFCTPISKPQAQRPIKNKLIAMYNALHQAQFQPFRAISHRSDYLVAIICTLPQELQAVLLLFDTQHDRVKYNIQDPYSYAFGSIGEHNIVAACLPKGQYGTCSATAVGTHLYNSFPNIKFSLLVGIGGGIPLDNDIRLGDVVVSSGNPGVVKYDFYRSRQGRSNELLGSSLKTPTEIDSLISQLTGNPNLKDPLQQYLSAIAKANPAYKFPGRQCDVLYGPQSIHIGHGACFKCMGPVLDRLHRDSDEPRIHYGTIATGDQVMKDATIRDAIGRDYGALCFEMEAGGLCALNKSCLVIRGICDYSDSHKHDEWQNYASAAAAAYAKFLLCNLRPLPKQ